MRACSPLANQWLINAQPWPIHPSPPPQVLEVAEARLVDVTVDGSLLVAADAVMGHWEDAGAHARRRGGVAGRYAGGRCSAAHSWVGRRSR